jgi:hypothetical protein
MANLIMAFPNWLDASPSFATVRTSGGVWDPDLPFDNVLSPEFADIAQTADANDQSMKRWIDYGVTRDTRVIAVPFFDGVSKDLKVRFRCFETWLDDTSTTIADTGWVDVYDVIYPTGTLPTWHVSFTDGKLTDEELSVYRVPFVTVFSEAVIGRYWLMEMSDAGSTTGYARLPRLYMAPGWQPTINAAYGAQLGFEDRSIRQEALGGNESYEILPGRRTARFGVDNLPWDEVLTYGLDMQVRLGLSGDVFFSLDPSDVPNRHRFSFPARMRTLNPVEAASFGIGGVPIELMEVL